jgi:hypothetical protein
MGAKDVATSPALLSGNESAPAPIKGAGMSKAVAPSATALPPSQQQKLDGLYSLMQSFEVG